MRAALLAAVLAAAARPAAAGPVAHYSQLCRKLAADAGIAFALDDCMLLQLRPGTVLQDKNVRISVNGQKLLTRFTLDPNGVNPPLDTYMFLNNLKPGDTLTVQAVFSDREGVDPAVCARSWTVLAPRTTVPGIIGCGPIEVFFNGQECSLVCN